MARKYDEEREQALMQQIFSDLPMQPDGLDEWVNDHSLGYSRYLFTWRERGIRYGYCTHCGTTSQLYPMPRTYSEQDTANAAVKHNDPGYCPACGSHVTFKDRGRGRGKMMDYGYFLIAQPVKDGGILVSSFYVLRDYRFDYHNIRTMYSEHYRVYFNAETGISRAYKRMRDPHVFVGTLDAIDYFEGDYGGLIGWEPMRSIPYPRYDTGNMYCGYVPPNYYYGFNDANFRNTNLRYSCISQFMRNCKAGKYELDVCRYLDLYTKNPVLVERMMKQGYQRILEEKVEKVYNTAGIINWKAKTVEKALKLPKGTLRAQNPKDTMSIIELQFCKRYNITNQADREWVKSQLKSRPDTNPRRLHICLKYMTAHKLLKYIDRIEAIEKQRSKFYYGNGLADYTDYITQCEELKLDMQQSFILWPKDFRKAHEENTALLTKIKMQEDMERAKQIDEAFRERYEKLCRMYAWRDKETGLLIRPAKGKADLMLEGKTLNHCVYTCYTDKYMRGEIIILLIRREKAPNIPYFTVELSAAETVIQCRGKRNCSPDDTVKKFLDDWKAELQSRKKKGKPKTTDKNTRVA